MQTEGELLRMLLIIEISINMTQKNEAVAATPAIILRSCDAYHNHNNTISIIVRIDTFKQVFVLLR